MSLEPISQLFTSKYMDQRRIINKDGTSVNYQAILGWFLPRYDSICDFIDKIHPNNKGLNATCKEDNIEENTDDTKVSKALKKDTFMLNRPFMDMESQLIGVPLCVAALSKLNLIATGR